MRRSEADEERFKTTVDRVTLWASLYPPPADVEFVLRELEKADAFGTIVDPTAWRTSLTDREALTALAVAAWKFIGAAEAFGAARAKIMAQRATGTDGGA